MNIEFKRMMELAGLTEIKVNKPGSEPESSYDFNRYEVNMDQATNIPTDKDRLEYDLQRVDLNVVEEVPFLFNVKRYIDDRIEDIKQNNRFEYLKNVGFFENEFEENIINHFEENMPNALGVSKKVKAYIDYLL